MLIDMRLRALAIALVAPVLAAGLCAPPEPTPPDQPGDCQPGPGELTVEPGTGLEAFVPLATEATAEMVYGSQGGMHVWTSVRATGFGTATVDIDVDAFDVFSGATVGHGGAYELRLNQLAGQSAGTCDYHGMRLFLNGRYALSGGLVRLVAKVTARDGRTAAGESRIWIGAAVPQCLPTDAAAPALVPRAEPVGPFDPPAHPIVEGETLLAGNTGARFETLVGADTLGLAASKLMLHVELRDPADPAAAPLATADSVPFDAYGEPYRLSGERCAPVLSAALPVGAALEGRDLKLYVKGDDGLGHTAEATRLVRVKRQLSP